MAVDTKGTQSGSDASSPRRVMVGTNVLVATALVVAIVVVAQLIAYKSHSRWDMTSSGVNSLSEGTENLLRNLDQNVRVTSLYFETDREDEDQSRYRRSAQDLLDLYEATNRTKVRAE